jgi:hypothetical protein
MARMKHLPIAAALLFVIACADSTAPTAARSSTRKPTAPAARDVDINETIPIAQGATNPCNGDAVQLAGTSHILIHSTTAASGNQHFYIDATNSLSGVGAPSLLSYQGETRDLFDFLTEDPFPIVETIYSDILLHSATNEDNFTFRFHYKITINANGTATAEILDSTNECTG